MNCSSFRAYYAKHGKSLRSILSRWDQRHIRRIEITASPLLRAILGALETYPERLMPTDGIMSVNYLSLVSTSSLDDFEMLLSTACFDARQEGVEWIAVSCHERDPKCQILDNLLASKSSLNLFAVENDDPVELDERVPYVEAGLIC